MPILVADGRDEGQTQLFTQNSTNYEFNPWEVGSFDDVGFAPLQYVGSNFSAGKIRSGEDCVVGFDQLSFVYGTSSSLFNQIILQMDSSDAIPHFLKGLLKSFLKQLGDEYNDIADWSPSRSPSPCKLETEFANNQFHRSLLRLEAAAKPECKLNSLDSCRRWRRSTEYPLHTSRTS